MRTSVNISAMTPGLSQHLEGQRPRIRRLRRSGRADSAVLGLLLTETFFRSRGDRALELLAWPVLALLHRTRLARLSVGPGQIQLRHWRHAHKWSSDAPTVARMVTVCSWEASYDLAASIVEGVESRVERARLYHGEARWHYIKILAHAEEWTMKERNSA